MTISYNRPLKIHIELSEGRPKEALSSLLQPLIARHLPGAQIERLFLSDGRNYLIDQNRTIVELLEVGAVILHIVVAYDSWKLHKKIEQALDEIRNLEVMLMNKGLPIVSTSVETLNGKKLINQIAKKDLIPDK